MTKLLRNLCMFCTSSATPCILPCSVTSAHPTGNSIKTISTLLFVFLSSFFKFENFLYILNKVKGQSRSSSLDQVLFLFIFNGQVPAFICLQQVSSIGTYFVYNRYLYLLCLHFCLDSELFLLLASYQIPWRMAHWYALVLYPGDWVWFEAVAFVIAVIG